MAYAIEDLLQLMARLRDARDGCPWDLQQSFASIVPHTLEESYELADAIEREDFRQIGEELGDLLFQVVFYAQLGREQAQFDFASVVDGLVGKLLRRHPHVFPDGTLSSRRAAGDVAVAEVKERWEEIKSAERQQKALSAVLDDIPMALPALSRACKLQKRAAEKGFDWADIEPVFEKLSEEIEEIHAARELRDKQALEEELGDLLFSCVNLARHLAVDPEQALRRANRKFEQRFSDIEQTLKAQGQRFEQVSLAELDRLWEQAKAKGL